VYSYAFFLKEIKSLVWQTCTTPIHGPHWTQLE